MCVRNKAGAQGPELGEAPRQVRMWGFLIRNRDQGGSLSCSRREKKKSDMEIHENGWLPLGERLGGGGAEHGTKGSPILPAMLIFKKKIGLGCSSVVQPQAYTRP